jgi:predicted transcriptional regulator
VQQVKETVKSLLDRLPDDCSIDDVLYHLYVIQTIESGLAEAAEDRLIPHETVAEELRRKWESRDDQ